MLCVNANRVTFAAFMLVEEAENRWRFTKQQLEYEEKQITWEIFKQKFLEKYFPEDLRRRKEVEFLNLRQRTMSVGEYAATFDELSKFCPYFHERVDERSVVQNLKAVADIKHTVSCLEISSSSILVNRYRIYENDTKARQAQWRQGGSLRHKRNELNHKKSYQRLSHTFWNSSRQNHPSPTNTSSMTNPIKCFQYGGPHISKNCPTKTVTCFNCGKTGHY